MIYLYILLSVILCVALFILIVLLRFEYFERKHFFNEMKPQMPKEETDFFPIFERLCEQLDYDYNITGPDDWVFYTLHIWEKGKDPKDGKSYCLMSMQGCFKEAVKYLVSAKESL